MRVRAAVGLASLFLVSVLAAGCAEGGAAAKAAKSSPPSSVVAATDAAGDLGSIRGTVVSDEDAPVPGARVSLTEPVALQATTDDAGHFAFQNLKEGTYNIFAERLGFETSARRVELADAEAKEVRFVLKQIEVVVGYNTTTILKEH